jgi:hypothetical protein
MDICQVQTYSQGRLGGWKYFDRRGNKLRESAGLPQRTQITPGGRGLGKALGASDYLFLYPKQK